MKIIKKKKSIIIAVDVPNLMIMKKIINSTCRVKGVGGYKIGLELGLSFGLPRIVSLIRQETNLPIIYDHQKGGTDIPEMGENFAKTCKRAKISGVILFPFGGKETEIAWIKACQKEKLNILIGGHMTQPKFLHREGGFVSDRAPETIFRIALTYGVSDFVVPGNKPEYVKKYKNFLKKHSGGRRITLYAPGFITQGGEISETGNAAGDNWHAIVGRAICEAKDPEKAAKKMAAQINQ